MLLCSRFYLGRTKGAGTAYAGVEGIFVESNVDKIGGKSIWINNEFDRCWLTLDC